MFHKLEYDQTDLVFRILFSLIFLGLGMEHLFSDAIIRSMMPDWLPSKRAVSFLAGIILLVGGISILLGYKTRYGAILLGFFILLATITIHLPAIFQKPNDLPEKWLWLWEVYQRSNLFKNFCLLGVCFLLIHHRTGKYSLDRFRKPN